MTADELATSYFIRARKRKGALDALMQAEAYPDVVREAQELVELVLKGMLRWIGVDPPHWHDVGPILVEQLDRFPPAIQHGIPRLAEISLRLRRDREAAFYGDIDLIPEHVFGRDAAERALAEADEVLAALGHFPLDRA